MKNAVLSIFVLAAGAAHAEGTKPPRALPATEAIAVPDSGVQGSVLRGLVFVAVPAQLAPRGLALESLQGALVDVSRAPLLRAPGFAEHIAQQGLIGAPLAGETLLRLRAAVSGWLRRSGRGATILIPEQDATSGVVQVVVTQPRLGAVRVEGAIVFPESAYRDSLRQRPGEPLDMLALEEDLAWIQRANPFRSAVAVAGPGQQAGETDITLQVSEQRPWKVGLWADNSGTESTQRERLGASITSGNFLGLGHLASYNLAVSPDLRSYVGHTVVYSLPLSWRDKVNFVGNYVRVHSRLPDPMESEGQAGGLLVRYDKYLRGFGNWTQGASLALDYKASDNNALFSNQPVFGNRTSILQLVGGYDANGVDAWGRTQLHLGVAASPGNTVSGNNDAAFNGSRAGAKARYLYANMSLLRETDLPAAWRWSSDARAQWSSENLLGTEQLPAMGMFGVRGFPEGGLYADRGLVWRNELGPGGFALGGQGTAQVFALFDAATVGSATPQPGEQGRYRFASLGLGARLSGAGWRIQLDAGKPVSENWAGDYGAWRAHARVSWEY